MTHRFYIGETKDRGGLFGLTEHIWVNDPSLVSQVLKVLRMRSGELIALFDGKGTERLYKIDEIEPQAFHLQHVTDLEPKHARRKVVLAFSMLKKDKNEWVFQKATELGATHFLPLITERTEKTGFDMTRAHKIIIEAAEQCGRHSIPSVNEPQTIESVIGQYTAHADLCVADMNGTEYENNGSDEVVVFVGPEGGWSDKERELFNSKSIPSINLGAFTLRAETACIAATQILS